MDRERVTRPTYVVSDARHLALRSEPASIIQTQQLEARRRVTAVAGSTRIAGNSQCVAADFADETYQAEMNRALEANLREQLRDTEEALRRFEEGTYGVCTNCGREIPLERLEAMPHASRCLDCQRKASTLG